MEIRYRSRTALSAGGSSFDQVFKVILSMSTKEALAEENTREDTLKEDSILTHLASEKILSRDWDSPEEDEAWKNL